MAFSASSSDKSLSGDLEELLQGDGLDALAMYPSLNRAVGAAAFNVQDALNLGLTVNHDPTWPNWYHGAIRGNLNRGNKQRLKNAAQVIVQIDQARARAHDDEKKAAAAARAAKANPAI